jgi:hypothetical protein
MLPTPASHPGAAAKWFPVGDNQPYLSQQQLVSFSTSQPLLSQRQVTLILSLKQLFTEGINSVSPEHGHWEWGIPASEGWGLFVSYTIPVHLSTMSYLRTKVCSAEFYICV